MFIPAAFREQRPQSLFSLIRNHSFGTLVSTVDGELAVTHLPFLLDAERGPHGTLVGHLARANPHWRAFDDAPPSLAIFQGPHAYISPGWYSTHPSVPTWNYTVVHAYGRPCVVDDSEQVRGILERTVATYESELPAPWTTAGLSEQFVDHQARAIVAFEMPIARIEGKWKLGQNRPAADIPTAAAGLRSRGDPWSNAIADLMLDVNRPFEE